MKDDINKVIADINSERKKESELLEFEKKHIEVSKYIKVVYDSYIEQGFTNEIAAYLSGIAYQACFVSK